MYDDLGALADKLKMSNVSFQEINKSEKEVSHAPLPATVNETVETMPPQAEKCITRPKSRTPARHIAETVRASSVRRRDTLSLMNQQALCTTTDRFPVRLDRLFTLIGK